MATNLLLLEDEVNVGSTLRDRLQIEGFQITWSQTITDAKKNLESKNFPLAILDVNLPDGSGFDVGKLIRDRYPSTAVVFLTAADTPEDRIHGLELGAEDYIVKPFNYKELFLRIQKALSRASYIQDKVASGSEIRIGRGNVRFHQYEIVVDGKRHTLTHKECALLKLLYEKRGQVVSRDDILDIVWSEDEYPTPRTIDNFILRLRKLLEPDPNSPTMIRSVRGVGYMMEADA
ncbi:MAG: response regulator transcription factor [Bdellovibrionales bacterium]|nr:response regulator transcription factor [Bdellovibrionales bacterium]